MKKSSFAALFLCLLMSVFSTSAYANELVFLNWADYIDHDLVAAFEKQYQVKVKEINFENDHSRTELLLNTQGQGFDVVLVVGNMLESYQRYGWLRPLDEQSIPNISHIAARWRDAYPAAKEYGVPYLWGTLGIVYRHDLVAENIDSWAQLYHPKPAWQSKILMTNESTELVGSALKALGYSLNSQTRAELQQAETLLLEQKPLIYSKYEYPDMSADSPLGNGKVWISMMYNGDALTVQENNPGVDIRFSVPKEGTELWCDYLTITQASQQPELAAAFINFMNQPEHAAKNSQTLKYATTNQSARSFIPAEYLENKLIYLSEEQLKNSEFVRQKSARAQKYWNNAYMRVISQ